MKRPRLRAALLLLAMLALLAACVFVHPLSRAISLALHGDVIGLRHQLRGLGVGGAIVLAALVLAHTIIPFPAEIPSAVAGFVYGFEIGLALMLLCFLLSALLAYALADWIGRPLARILAGESRLEAMERLVGRGGVRTLLVLRVIPFVPFSLMCFVCGLAHVPLRRYTWTTAAGMLPQLTLVTLLGSRLAHASVTDPLLWAPGVAIIMLLALGPTLLRRLRVTTS